MRSQHVISRRGRGPGGGGRGGLFRLAAEVAAALVLVLAATGSGADRGWEAGPNFRRAPLLAPTDEARPGFTALAASATGIAFSNSLSDADAARNLNLMLGSGVAAGDYDGDGRCDLYFCSLTGSNALYRNLGGWRFGEVTAAAGAGLPDGTNTGAVFADVDGDGDLDLLVSSLGVGVRLLINRGQGAFEDGTTRAGLAGRAGALTMALGDLDGDRDLDLYVCHYGAVPAVRGSDLEVRQVNGKWEVRGPPNDRVRVDAGRLVELGEADAWYRNRGDGTFERLPWGSDLFVDEEGRPLPAPLDFGLAAQVRDFNGDGAPDVYVCNDFDTPDRFWLNDGRGRFRLASWRQQRVQSASAMGVDGADVDRDGRMDFFVVEMLSPDPRRRLMQRNPMIPAPARAGQFAHRAEVGQNTLFHARADGTFAEISRYAGVHASDWSWQGSFLDVDLDGWEDLLVVTGHLFDVQALDVPAVNGTGPAARAARLHAHPRLHTPNHAWRNRGDLTFEPVSAAWGFDDTNLCPGLAFADLDEDGDLDVVLPRLNASPLLLRNNAAAPRVAVRLRGLAPNTEGVGARVTLHTDGQRPQSQEIIAGGKYLCDDETVRVFAAARTGGAGRMRLEIRWRSGAVTTVTNVAPNYGYEVAEPAGATELRGAPMPGASLPPAWFQDESASLAHVHAESDFDDFQVQPLLTRKLSQRGPGICVIDLDGDGHDDVVMGAGRGGRITWHRGDGRGGFAAMAVDVTLPEDVLGLAAWTPVPGGRGVLVSLAAGETSGAETPVLLQWLSVRAGALELRPALARADLFPRFPVASCLAVGDYDGDGDLDVFLGAHALPGRYPAGGPSQLLRNDQGRLRLDPTNGPALLNLGLVNSALWTDLDEDGWLELVVACEWGPVRLFANERGRLREITGPTGLGDHTGCWTGVAAADVDGDGQRDLVAGNWGWNGQERASVAAPQVLLHGDFLGRGVVDLLEAEYRDRATELYPARGLAAMGAAVPEWVARFGSHRAWAGATAREIVGAAGGVRTVTATTLAATVFLRRGGRFEPHPLPAPAQWSPAWSVLAEDLDGDGHVDLFLSQNFFALRPDYPRLDAGLGLVLRGDGRGGWAPVSEVESGVSLWGEQRGAATGDFDGDGRLDLVVGQNGAPTALLQNRRARPGLHVRLAGPRGNPLGMGAAVAGARKGQLGRWQEVGGGGWLSQSAGAVVLSSPPAPGGAWEEVRVRWPGGRMTVVPISAGLAGVQIRHPEADAR